MRVMNSVELSADDFEVHLILEFSRKMTDTDNEASSMHWFLTFEFQGTGKWFHKAT